MPCSANEQNDTLKPGRSTLVVEQDFPQQITKPNNHVSSGYEGSSFEHVTSRARAVNMIDVSQGKGRGGNAQDDSLNNLWSYEV